MKKYDKTQKCTITAKDLAKAGVQGYNEIENGEQQDCDYYVKLSDEAKMQVDALMEMIFGNDDKDK